MQNYWHGLLVGLGTNSAVPDTNKDPRVGNLEGYRHIPASAKLPSADRSLNATREMLDGHDGAGTQ
eukprot:scaffold36529_cov18-Tisochrysis_lutea.AAC.2